MPGGKSEIKVTASDALEFEQVEARAAGPKRRVGALVIVLALAGAGAGLWFAYGDRLTRVVGGGSEEVPLIRAEISPVKIRPANPGGLQIPNRDKLVYGRMQGAAGGGPPTVERLLADPEQPKPAPVGKMAAVTTAPKVAPSVARVPKVTDIRKVEPPPPPPPPSVSAGGRTPLKLRKGASPLRLEKNAGGTAAGLADRKAPAASRPAVSKTVAKPVAPKPRPAPPPTPAKAVRSTVGTPKKSAVYRVQLAAARTEDGAQAEWDRVRRRNLDLLGDLGLIITKVNLGAKGIFYRVRVGPLAGERRARELCKALGKRKIGCLIVKPDRS